MREWIDGNGGVEGMGPRLMSSDMTRRAADWRNSRLGAEGDDGVDISGDGGGTSGDSIEDVRGGRS